VQSHQANPAAPGKADLFLVNLCVLGGLVVKLFPCLSHVFQQD
jgi:hypothetical protein